MWGDHILLSAVTGDEGFCCSIDVDMFSRFDFTPVHTFELYKIVSLPRILYDFRPNNWILIERLPASVRVPDSLQFWGGAERESELISKETEAAAKRAAA